MPLTPWSSVADMIADLATVETAGRSSPYSGPDDPRLIAILGHIRRGVSPSRAAVLAGIHRDTISGWRQEYPEIEPMIEQAEAWHISDAADRLRACTTKWGTPDPKALELELRRYPEYRQHQEVTQTSTTLNVTLQVNADQMREIQARHAASLDRIGAPISALPGQSVTDSGHVIAIQAEAT